MESKTLVKDEIWAFQNSDPGFSPNDEYVCFTAIRNFEQDIFIHNLKDNKTINLTNTGVTESSPVWSPDGKYIYFFRAVPNLLILLECRIQGSTGCRLEKSMNLTAAINTMIFSKPIKKR
jgi:Tol biopolymer transport system component